MIKSIHSDNPTFFSSLKVLKHATATPITNLLINLELLCKDKQLKQLSSNSRLYLEKAIVSTNYLKSIMKQCSNQQASANLPFRIKDSIYEVINICKKPKTEAQLISYIQLSENECLSGNKLYFQEAIICLLNNAFQAYSKNHANKLVVLFASKIDSCLEIKIVDGATGFLELNDCEIKNNNKSNTFTSCGVGLEFVRKVVVEHFGGKFQISSKHNRGSTVQCFFPSLVNR